MACTDVIPPFEGPEKKLEVDFYPNPYMPYGFRALKRQDWEPLLQTIGCHIESEIHNDYCDSYLLSESSLFVYPYQVMIKTCGHIMLLFFLEHLEALSAKFVTTASRISFSRRNLFFPDDQKSPHKNFEDEVDYLRTHLPDGYTHIFGPRSCDHHYYFVSYNKRPNPYAGVNIDPGCWVKSDRHQTLEILMTGMSRDVMEQFYLSNKFDSPEHQAREITKTSGIQSLFTDLTMVDAHQFEPLGYSLNGLDDQIYYTIHITPQPECAFVSFETNLVLKDYSNLVQRVVDVFQPQSFTVLLVRDGINEEKTSTYNGFYARNHAHHNFPGSDHHISFFSFRLHEKRSNSRRGLPARETLITPIADVC